MGSQVRWDAHEGGKERRKRVARGRESEEEENRGDRKERITDRKSNAEK